MPLLVKGQTVTGTFDGTSHGILVNTYTFNASKGDTVILRAAARGYNPAQLTVRVKGPSPATSVIGVAVAILNLPILVTGLYIVELLF